MKQRQREYSLDMKHSTEVLCLFSYIMVTPLWPGSLCHAELFIPLTTTTHSTQSVNQEKGKSLEVNSLNWGTVTEADIW